MDKMKVAVCAIMLDENQYLEEWLAHYRNIGVDHFFIYDNGSKIPIKNYLRKDENWNKDVTIIDWVDDKFKSQSRAYIDCARNNRIFDFIGFFDADEFYMSKSMSIKKDIENLYYNYGKFDALGVYWRIYGNNPPFETRQPVENYKMWFGDKHIKSWINPKVLIDFPDPHKGLIFQGNYIDELGRKIISPIGSHTSESIYIKHIFTRSKKEYEDKMKRGDANLRKNLRTWDDFYNYNKLCIMTDV